MTVTARDDPRRLGRWQFAAVVVVVPIVLVVGLLCCASLLAAHVPLPVPAALLALGALTATTVPMTVYGKPTRAELFSRSRGMYAVFYAACFGCIAYALAAPISV